MSFIAICLDSDLSEGDIKAFHLKKGSLVLVRQNGNIFAVQETCTHDDFSMEDGYLVEDGIIECAAHGARFRMENGDAIEMPATEPLETYEVRINDGMIEVNLD